MQHQFQDVREVGEVGAASGYLEGVAAQAGEGRQIQHFKNMQGSLCQKVFKQVKVQVWQYAIKAGMMA